MPKYLSVDGERIIDAYVRKGKEKLGATPVFITDKEGNLLNTEPLCVIYEKYFPWFFRWLEKKFEEDREKRA